jgi:sugar/nucleoside kinase (ribokinase family)
MSLLAVGSVAFDTVETPHRKSERALGGAATYFSLAASFFAPVRLVGVVGEDFTARHEAVLRKRRIDLRGLEHAAGKTFFWAGRYGQNPNERVTLATELNVFANFNPKLPQSYRGSEIVFLANIQPGLQHSVLRQMRRRPRLVGLDTMNYWIEREPAELKRTLRMVDVLIINDEEVRQLTRQNNLVRAAEVVHKIGPKVLVIKRGEHGATLMTRQFIFAIPGYPLRDIHDPTGAGDSFAGGFLGSLARDGKNGEAALRRGMVYGSVMGSFAVERFGVERLSMLKRSEIAERARRFLRLTHFQL